MVLDKKYAYIELSMEDFIFHKRNFIFREKTMEHIAYSYTQDSCDERKFEEIRLPWSH